jgi:hypothetical protein
MAQANVGCREWLGEGTSHIDMQEVVLGVALLTIDQFGGAARGSGFSVRVRVVV